MVKTCIGCGPQPISSFGKRAATKDGLNAKCRSCWNTYLTSRRRADPDALLKQREWNRNQRKRVTDKIRELKTDKTCADCGESRPHYILQFDHRQGTKKKCDIARMPALGSIPLLLTEVAKCDLVCANCHAERTHQRRVRSRRQADKAAVF